MKRKQAITFILLLMSTFITYSCDSHEPYDPNVHIGYVLCDDHSCMDTAKYFNQSIRKAVGVVFAEETDEHPALIVSLKETNGVFCDSLGMENGTSGSIDKYDGFTNTIAMYKSYNPDDGHGSPIAMDILYFHEYGQSDYIPSVAEMYKLVKALSIVNPIIERCGGTPIQTLGNCWYWTSTEVKENPGIQAWLCSAVNGRTMPTSKTESHRVRAIFQLNDHK